jgi:hypothetical protein
MLQITPRCYNKKKKTTENQNCTGKIFIQQELKTKQLPCCINIVQVVS